jgi:hypothetical protein
MTSLCVIVSGVLSQGIAHVAGNIVRGPTSSRLVGDRALREWSHLHLKPLRSRTNTYPRHREILPPARHFSSAHQLPRDAASVASCADGCAVQNQRVSAVPRGIRRPARANPTLQCPDSMSSMNLEPAKPAPRRAVDRRVEAIPIGGERTPGCPVPFRSVGFQASGSKTRLTGRTTLTHQDPPNRRSRRVDVERRRNSRTDNVADARRGATEGRPSHRERRHAQGGAATTRAAAPPREAAAKTSGLKRSRAKTQAPSGKLQSSRFPPALAWVCSAGCIRNTTFTLVDGSHPRTATPERLRLDTEH